VGKCEELRKTAKNAKNEARNYSNLSSPGYFNYDCPQSCKRRGRGWSECDVSENGLPGSEDRKQKWEKSESKIKAKMVVKLGEMI
jgi:hypothetical protein